jgi:hypothetical protein
MDLLEVKSLFENSVRCLAISMQEAIRRQLFLLTGGDLAMNDHLVSHLPLSGLYDDSDGEECLEALKNMYKGLLAVEAFFYWDYQNFSILDWEAPELATLMMTTVGGFKDENLPPCAIEVQNLSRELLRSVSGEPNDIEFNKLLKKFLDGTKKIAEKYHIDLELGDGYSLPMGYLADWFKYKYWR